VSLRNRARRLRRRLAYEDDRDQRGDGGDRSAGRRVKEEMVARRDDDKQHKRWIGEPDQPRQKSSAVANEPGADHDRVGDMQARHGRDRVVDGAHKPSIQVDVATRDRVDDPEPREPGWRSWEEHETDQGERGREDERCPDGGERSRPALVSPEEEA
jgi:hypothetical protein